MDTRIKEFREDNDLTQQLTDEILVKLSQVYGVTTDYILRLTDKQK